MMDLCAKGVFKGDHHEYHNASMKIVLLGAPGSGKGTHALDISKNFNILHISTGNIFRDAVKNKTAVGIKAEDYMNRGELVQDDIVVQIVVERLRQPDCQNGFVLDGFPRTKNQAEIFEQVLKPLHFVLDIVMNLSCSEEIIVDRLTGRRVCKNCSRSFHIRNIPPKKEGLCDGCGGVLFQREDDSAATIQKRLKIYEEQTSPLIDFYKSRKLLWDVDAGLKRELTYQLIEKFLKNLKKS